MRDWNGDGDTDSRDYYDADVGALQFRSPDTEDIIPAPATRSLVSFIFYTTLAAFVLWLLSCL